MQVTTKMVNKDALNVNIGGLVASFCSIAHDARQSASRKLPAFVCESWFRVQVLGML